MNLRNISDLLIPLGRAGIVFPVGLSLLFFFNGEFEKAPPLALYAIVSLLITKEL